MRIKVAVASNDGMSISKHFGRTNRFAVFDVENGEILSEEARTVGTDAPDDGHCGVEPPSRSGARHQREVMAMLDGCQVVLCRGMGWRAATELVRRGINPLVIVGDFSPRMAVEHYLAGTLQPAPGFCRRQKRPAAAADSVEPTSGRF